MLKLPYKPDAKESEQLNKNISLARQLGIKFRFVTNRDIVKAIVDFALKENITHIIIGKPRVRNLFTLLRLGNFVNRLIRYSGNIDVYILGSDIQSKDKFKKNASLPSFTSNIRQYFTAAFIVIFIAVICFFIKESYWLSGCFFCIIVRCFNPCILLWNRSDSCLCNYERPYLGFLFSSATLYPSC